MASSIPDWRAALAAALARRQPDDRPARVSVVGVGNELAGDDAAGLTVARGLQERLAAQPASRAEVQVIDAGPAPENQTGPLRRFAPDLVLLVDAAQMDAPPGAVRWVDWQEIDGLSASTHTLPLNILAGFLVAELGCDVAVIGLQPAGNETDAPLSREARVAVDTVVEGLAEAL